MPVLLRPKLTRIHDGAASFAKHNTPEENGSRDDREEEFENYQVFNRTGGAGARAVCEVEFGGIAMVGDAIAPQPGFARAYLLINENLRDG